MRHFNRWIISLLFGAIVAGQQRPARGQTTAAAHDADARLNDVCLVDGTRAWAVGDRGTILHSADGGRTWQRQTASAGETFDARLTSVHFVDAQTGWAVGGTTQPHTLGSRGLVLATTDAGRTWRELPARNLPALERAEFFDANRGVAIGRATSMQPSGIFVTEDGGKTWQAVPGGRGWTWRTGDFTDPFTGAVAGRGLWAAVDRRTLNTPSDEPPRVRAIRDMQLVPPVGGWAAGDGGLVVTTPDLGRTWYEPDAAVPHDAARHFDFLAVAAHGSSVWVAGSPGSRIFHSPDAGRTWQGIPTGITTPISALAFVGDGEASRGIAVGELGTILITGDGGRSWTLSRQACNRTPLLAVGPREEAIPFEILAESAAADGYLAATCVLLRESLEDTTTRSAPYAVVTRSNDDPEARVQEATLLAGGTASSRAWRFPTSRDAVHVLSELDRVTDGRGLAELEAYLVRQIRTWRPDVIVLGDPPEGPTDADRLAREALLAAVAAAADPTRHIEVATEAGLSAWPVKRVYAAAPEGAEAELTIATTSFVPHIGRTVGEIAGDARAVLAESAAPADAVALQQIHPRADAAARHRHAFDGLELAAGSGPRRAVPAMSDEQLEQAAAAAEKRRDVHAILVRSLENIALASHVTAFSEGLSDSAQAQILYQLAEANRSTGRWDLAAANLERLVREHPDDRLVDAALVWLVQYHAGSETKWARRSGISGQQLEVRGQRSSDSGRKSEVGLAEPLVADAVDLRDRAGGRSDGGAVKAIEMGRLATELRPQLVLEPHIGVPLAAAYRRSGLVNEADRYMLLLRQRGAGDAWQGLAEAERWLMTPTGHPPELPIWTCRRTTQRPHLDGILDEAFWDSARAAILAPPDDELTDTSDNAPNPHLKLAYDSEFLYLALQVNVSHPRAAGTAADAAPRSRDQDLSGRDRIHLAVDVDRDLTTFYEWTIDDRGHVSDRAWHGPRWNPKAYVAHAVSGGSWTIEAAIPLLELVDAPLQSRDVWCISAALVSADGRTTPWHGPATPVPSPASFGLLIFE